MGQRDLGGVADGGSTTYSFVASSPGTYLYEAGPLPGAQHQVAMGLFGALVYFFQAAETFGEYAFAIIQTLFWPGFLVYEALISPGKEKLGRLAIATLPKRPMPVSSMPPCQTGIPFCMAMSLISGLVTARITLTLITII